jgi:hypothetical protein
LYAKKTLIVLKVKSKDQNIEYPKLNIKKYLRIWAFLKGEGWPLDV